MPVFIKGRWLMMAALILMAAACQGRKETPEKHDHEKETAKGRDSTVVEISIEAQQKVGIGTEPVAPRIVRASLAATGIVRPNENRTMHIRPLVRGLIEKVFVNPGDTVRAEQPLLRYDAIELGEIIGDYVSLFAELEKSQAQLEVSKRARDRGKELFDREAIARKEYELREAEYKTALADVERKRAEVAKVEEKLHRFGLTEQDIEKLHSHETRQDFHRKASHSVLKASFDAVVLKRAAAEGEVVSPDKELFTLVDLSSVWILADIYEKDLARVRTGQPVRIVVAAYPGEQFSGTVDYVSDLMDPTTRTVKARCIVKNAQRKLKLEMFTTVYIDTPASRSIITVPTEALQSEGKEVFVYVQVAETKFQKRLVETGPVMNGHVEVKAGLNAGDRVVTKGAFYIKSEAKKESLGEAHAH